jgi:hypothetical protein
MEVEEINEKQKRTERNEIKKGTEEGKGRR